MLAKYNIKSVSLPPRKIYSYLPAAKDALGLRMPGVYSIPCDCGKFYTGHIKFICRGITQRKEYNIHNMVKV
jgi:hypothetical protein